MDAQIELRPGKNGNEATQEAQDQVDGFIK